MSMQKHVVNGAGMFGQHTVSWADAAVHEGGHLLMHPSQVMHPINDFHQVDQMKNGYLSRRSRSIFGNLQKQHDPNQVESTIEPNNYEGPNSYQQAEKQGNRSINQTYLKQRQQQVNQAVNPQKQAGKDGPQA